MPLTPVQQNEHNSLLYANFLARYRGQYIITALNIDLFTVTDENQAILII
jgi:hypothetical protein